jgi:hypothetical protein
MKKEFIDAVKNGRILKTNKFETARGTYTIYIVRKDDTFYFYKVKDGKIVECVNLSEVEGIPIDAQ